MTVNNAIDSQQALGTASTVKFGQTLIQNNPIFLLTDANINATGTASGTQLFGGIIHCAPAGAMTLTFDTAANIYSAMGSPTFVGATFKCSIVATSGVVTIAGNTGLTTVIGTTTISGDMRNFLFVVTNTSTPTITVYGG
jgi:hypothetical protein